MTEGAYRAVPLDEARLEEVAALEALCFSEPWSASALRLLLAPENLGVVLLCEGRAVAYGGMTTVLDEGAVTNVATHPDLRRRGLGRAVVRALLVAARERGLATVFLEVRVSNEAARRLYETEGFETVGLRRGFYSHPAEDGLVMRCALTE